MNAPIVATHAEPDGAFQVATASGGTGRADARPFAFERAADARFVACLCEPSSDSVDDRAATPIAAREAVDICAGDDDLDANAISRGLLAAHERAIVLGAACNAVLVVADAAAVHVGWVGTLEAMVIRDAQVVHRSVSTLHRALGRPMRGREPGIDLAGPWSIEPRDLVLLCSRNVHEVLSEGDVTALANRDDLATIVRGLVTTTSTRGDFVEISAIAIRTC